MVLLHRADVIRLDDTASGAPYFANELTLRESDRLRRDYVEIMAVVAGEGGLLTYPSGSAPHRIRLRPGTMVLFRPRDNVRFVSDGEDGLTLRYVSLSEADWETLAGFVGLDPEWALTVDPPLARFDPDDEDVLSAFRVALERFRAVPASLDLLHFLASTIPVLFPNYGRRRAGLGAPRWLADSVEAMRDEANLRGGVPRLLELSRVSASYLSVTVRRYFGSTPTALVGDLRLRRAALLLSITDEPIRTVANRCGFDNVNYFSTAFRRTHHVSPREYRARSRSSGLGTAASPR